MADLGGQIQGTYSSGMCKLVADTNIVGIRMAMLVTLTVAWNLRC